MSFILLREAYRNLVGSSTALPLILFHKSIKLMDDKFVENTEDLFIYVSDDDKLRTDIAKASEPIGPSQQFLVLSSDYADVMDSIVPADRGYSSKYQKPSYFTFLFFDVSTYLCISSIDYTAKKSEDHGSITVFYPGDTEIFIGVSHPDLDAKFESAKESMEQVAKQNTIVVVLKRRRELQQKIQDLKIDQRSLQDDLECLKNDTGSFRTRIKRLNEFNYGNEQEMEFIVPIIVEIDPE